MATLFTQSDAGFTAEQHLDAKLDYGLDWSSALAPGDEIASSVWTALPPGGPVNLSNATASGTLSTVWVEVTDPAAAGQWFTLKNTVTTTAGRRDSRLCLLYVKPDVHAGTGLFPNRAVAIAQIRRDRLTLLANSLLPGLQVTDDYIWDKLRAAESYVSGLLRVPLVPTRYFPIQPTAADLAAWAGRPWAIDPGYDYQPEMFSGDKWGYIVTRHRPILSVQYMRFCYPSQENGFFDVPVEWLRVDSRPGHIRMVPASAGILVGSAGFALSTLINRRAVPDMVQVSYTAGLENAAGDFPDLLDVVKKKAVLNLLNDAYLPQSGSISADGLSQSMSVDMDKYADAIDEIINGPKGSNGGLMTRIHGIRTMVI